MSEPVIVDVASTSDDSGGRGIESAWEKIATLDEIFGKRFARSCGISEDSWKLEGPEIVELPEGLGLTVGRMGERKTARYMLFADRYASSEGYISFLTTDLSSREASDWEVVHPDFDRLRKRHGCVIRVSENEYQALEKAYEEE
jgi:hypothetical protein